MKKEIIVNAGGKVEQKIINTEIKKSPPSVSIGPVKASHDNIAIAVGVVLVLALAWVKAMEMTLQLSLLWMKIRLHLWQLNRIII